MAKKKQFQIISKSSGNKTSKKTLRAQNEQCYIVARKIFRHFELDPGLIDVFTKRQRERLLHVFYLTPVVRPDRERTVPRQYIRNINTEMYQFLKNNYWGKPENNITLSELATYGLSFLSNIEYAYREKEFDESTPQFEAARKICEKFDSDQILANEFDGLMTNIYHLTGGYSRINYRMYGFSFHCEKIKKSCGCCYEYRFAVRITAQDSESKLFTNHNIERKAFRMHITNIGLYKPQPVTIARKKIFPDAEENEMLNIYVQSHVLHRFKERMDVYPPTDQNILIQRSFTFDLKLITFDKQVLFACLVGKHPAGYFTFFVQNDDMVINTFLPLSSSNTPEGNKLHEILSLTKEELVYLGMDKLSFYLKVDFEQIPELKQALIDSNIWQTKVELEDPKEELEDFLIDLNKTNFVKNYLSKRGMH